MQPQMDNSTLDRRAFVLGAGAVAALAPLLAGRVAAQEAAPAWREALQKIVGDAQPTSGGRLTFDLPQLAENGNMVPFTVSVESPMTDKDHVKAIHILATENPQPNVASFRFTPLSGRASVASRMRLARTQEVIGLAELGDGKFLMARRSVRVTISGCGGG
jgi:sulfur-oxidizing protein SoxY